ncbi:hypothetical protein BMF94_2638 [Rhodotorula taiwanensis]|uniref:SAP domain-containing protein n=1 Tax=Rhodotorula taiwanensis TaxID=741276 RepID=A0A2S5BCD9_9BASI|nr:hypothetical protein BMF94_2638 [Rhodotorula taiwanensis]
MPLSVSELRAALAALSLDSRGNKDTLKKRWLRANKLPRETAGSSDGPGQEEAQARRGGQPNPAPRSRPPDQEYDSFLVFDVEATCERIEEPWGKLAFAYPNEIIEWPVVLLQWQRRTPSDGQQSDTSAEAWDLVQVDEYHSYVKPTWATRISAFCTELTGITQDDLESAPTFPTLCSKFQRDFLQRHGLFTPENRTIWVTDGPWDLRDFVSKTCYLSNTPRPDWLAGEIIDLRLLTCTFFALLKKEKKEHARASRSPSPLLNREQESPPTAAGVAGELTAAVSAEAELQASLPSPVPSAEDAGLPVALGSAATPTPSTAEKGAPTTASSPTDYLPSHLLTAPAVLNLPSVLLALSLPAFEGRLHSGLSDARNASRILIDLARRGMVLEANRRVPEGGKGRERRWGWMEPGRGSQVILANVQRRWEEHIKKEKVREAQIAMLR